MPAIRATRATDIACAARALHSKRRDLSAASSARDGAIGPTTLDCSWRTNRMSPLIISAQFAAYTWFTTRAENAAKGPAEAMQFARERWEDFLPLANRGLGRLLQRMAELPQRKARKAR